MQIIKFGGGALINQNMIDNTLSIITSLKKPLIVVISAIGRKGFPFATDTIIDSLNEIYITPKEYDRLISIGETYSSIFLANICNKRGLKAYSLSYLETGIHCNDNYGEGRVDLLSSENILSLKEKYDVIIVPGFIGNSSENEIITLGRNTSDYSCILLASIFKENKAYLYKDINGIYPTSINALNNKIKPFSFLSYEEMIALCDIGFKVVSKKAIEEAKNNSIEIVIVNFFNKKEGTLISKRGTDNKILGFNIIYEDVLIATLLPFEMKSELELLLKTQHVFIKNVKVEKNYLVLKININQLMIVKQLLMKYYFSQKN